MLSRARALTSAFIMWLNSNAPHTIESDCEQNASTTKRAKGVARTLASDIASSMETHADATPRT